MPLLAARGYRVIAPDLRGYGTSAKPPKVKDYALDRLVEDVTGVLDALGHPTAHVVGHDWGGALAWQVARAVPERVDRLAVINCPPFDVMQRAPLRDPLQPFRSWYIFAFQLPILPQWSSSLRDFALLTSIMIRSARPGTFSTESLAGHRKAWSNPDALRSMIHWYRAGLRHPPAGGKRITVPVLLLWGEQDRFLGTSLIGPTEALCESLRVVRFPDHTHWLPHEAPEAVMEHILQFFERSEDEA
jgi:pimeloyl-ACP methyl ester carboxylesterase